MQVYLLQSENALDYLSASISAFYSVYIDVNLYYKIKETSVSPLKSGQFKS